MKKINNKLLFLSIVQLGIAGCSSVKNREPSGKIDAQSAKFNLVVDQKISAVDYSFSLLNFDDLQKSKVSFQTLNFKSQKDHEILNAWISQLPAYIDSLDDDLDFSYQKEPISVKKSDFTQLKNALDLLAINKDSEELTLKKQLEVISSFNNNFKRAFEMKLEILAFPVEIVKRLSPFRIKNGEDDSDLKVKNSSFWTDRSNEKINMATGQSTMDLSPFKTTVCDYSGAKTGRGTHLGFKIKCFDKKFKVKMGEVETGPFNTRLYYRLGFNVPAINYLPGLKVRYNSKIFTELYAGKNQYLDVTLAKARVKEISVSRKGKMLEKIAYAVLKNGDKMSSKDFFQKLHPVCDDELNRCQFDDKKFDPSIERDVDYLVFNPVAVAEDAPEKEFGSWDYDDLDHKERTELRSLVLLGAWTGNYDLRRDNTKLQWNSKTGEIRHFISDCGTAFSNQSLPGKPFHINKMKWEVSDRIDTVTTDDITGEESIDSDYQIHFLPLMDHKVFKNLTLPEARWMVRLIAGVSESELTEALIASGFSMSEMLLAREKLISIQKNYIETFKLQKEFPALMNRTINKKMNYQSNLETSTLVLPNGHSYEVEERDHKIVNGKLITSSNDSDD